MTTSFVPFSRVKLSTNFDDEIRCITSDVEYLYVGFKNGSIKSCQVNRNTGSTREDDPYIVRTSDFANTGSKPVDQIQVCPELNLLIARANNKLHFFRTVDPKSNPALAARHDFRSEDVSSSVYPHDSRADVTLFRLNVARLGGPTKRWILLVAKKDKKMRVTQWDPANRRFQTLKDKDGAIRGELDIPASPMALAIVDNYIYLAFSEVGSYMQIDYTTAKGTEKLPIKRGRYPVMECLPSQELLVGHESGGEQLGLFLKAGGTPANRSTLKWTLRPQFIAFSFPYLLSIDPRSALMDIHSWNNPSPDSRYSMAIQEGVIAVSDSVVGSDYEWTDMLEQQPGMQGRNPVYLVYNTGLIYRLEPSAPEQQAESLLALGKVDDAEFLLESVLQESEEGDGREMASFQLCAGRILWFRGQYMRAIKHLKAAQIDPRELLVMFPQLQLPKWEYIPEHFTISLISAIHDSHRPTSDAALSQTRATAESTAAAAKVLRENEYRWKALQLPTIEQQVERTLQRTAREEQLEEAARAKGGKGRRGGFFGGGGGGGDADDAAAQIAQTPYRELYSLSRLPAVPKEQVDQAVEQVYMAVTKYLETYRALLQAQSVQQRLIDPVDEHVDTALLVALVMSMEYEGAMFLVSQENKIDLEVAHRVLDARGLQHILAKLFVTRKLYEDALALWRKLGEGEITSAHTNGVAETIEFLSQSDDFDMVKRYSNWLFQRVRQQIADGVGRDRDWERAVGDVMSIFTSTKRKVELPPRLVLDHLKTFPDLKPYDLTAQYLEFLVAKGNRDEQFHTKLAGEYISSVAVLRKAAQPEYEARLQDDDDDYEVPTAGREPPPLGPKRAKLINFLTNGRYYNTMQVLSMLSGTLLTDEMAIVYSRVGDHRKALALILNETTKPQRHVKAEKYCLRNSSYDRDHPRNQRGAQQRASGVAEYDDVVTGRADSGGAAGGGSSRGVDPFTVLLQYYFQPTDPDTESLPDVARFRQYGLDLLQRHATKMNSADVLELIPSDMPLAAVMPYLTQAIPHLQHEAMTYNVAAKLFRVETLRRKHELATLEQRHAGVDANTKCVYCNKIIRDSAIFVYPNNDIIHHFCRRYYDEARAGKRKFADEAKPDESEARPAAGGGGGRVDAFAADEFHRQWGLQ